MSEPTLCAELLIYHHRGAWSWRLFVGRNPRRAKIPDIYVEPGWYYRSANSAEAAARRWAKRLGAKVTKVRHEMRIDHE